MQYILISPCLSKQFLGIGTSPTRLPQTSLTVLHSKGDRQWHAVFQPCNGFRCEQNWAHTWRQHTFSFRASRFLNFRLVSVLTQGRSDNHFVLKAIRVKFIFVIVATTTCDYKHTIKAKGHRKLK